MALPVNRAAAHASELEQMRVSVIAGLISHLTGGAGPMKRRTGSGRMEREVRET